MLQKKVSEGGHYDATCRTGPSFSAIKIILKEEYIHYNCLYLSEQKISMNCAALATADTEHLYTTFERYDSHSDGLEYLLE
jgi:hypothetical protein